MVGFAIMSRKKKRTILFVVLGVLVLGGWAAWQSQKGHAVSVLAAKVAEEDIVSRVTANGKIQAENKVELSALVMGQIVNLAAREGDRVKKGQFLLQYRPEPRGGRGGGIERGAPGHPLRSRLGQGHDGAGRARVRARPP